MENQRIRLSKSLLKSALMRLLRQKPIEKVTIYELCAEAQINRTTFYKYYGSQYDLLTDIEEEYFCKLEQILSETESSGEDSLFRMLVALLANEEDFKILINALPDKDFSDKLFNLPTIKMQLNRTIPDTFSQDERELLRLFFYQGGYALIRDWLNRDVRESPKKMARFLNGVILKLTQ